MSVSLEDGANYKRQTEIQQTVWRTLWSAGNVLINFDISVFTGCPSVLGLSEM